MVLNILKYIVGVNETPVDGAIGEVVMNAGLNTARDSVAAVVDFAYGKPCAIGPLPVETSLLPSINGLVGSLVLGTESKENSTIYTYDCWKCVLHDLSLEPSQGKLIAEVGQFKHV